MPLSEIWFRNDPNSGHESEADGLLSLANVCAVDRDSATGTEYSQGTGDEPAFCRAVRDRVEVR